MTNEEYYEQERDDQHYRDTTPVSERTDWAVLIDEVNERIKRLQQKPGSIKIGYSVCPGGILNAYREGDLTFEEDKAEFNTMGGR